MAVHDQVVLLDTATRPEWTGPVTDQNKLLKTDPISLLFSMKTTKTATLYPNVSFFSSSSFFIIRKQKKILVDFDMGDIGELLKNSYLFFLCELKYKKE